MAWLPGSTASELAARGVIRHAASLGLFAEGGVAESSQYPDTTSFRLLALDENPGARRRAGLHHGLLVAKPRIAIAPIDYSASIPQHTREAVHATVVEAVQSIARDALLLDVDAECRTRECALRQAGDANAEYLLELRLTVDQRDYVIEIAVIDADTGRQLTDSTGECQLCAQVQLLATIAAQVAALESAMSEAWAPPPNGDPPPDPPPLRVEPISPRKGLQVGGWVSFAVGLASVGAGAALLALDGREHQPTCGNDLRDINGACPNVYTTGLAGIISTSTGAVVLATGTGLVIAGKGKRQPSAAARLTTSFCGLRLEF